MDSELLRNLFCFSVRFNQRSGALARICYKSNHAVKLINAMDSL